MEGWIRPRKALKNLGNSIEELTTSRDPCQRHYNMVSLSLDPCLQNSQVLHVPLQYIKLYSAARGTYAREQKIVFCQSPDGPQCLLQRYWDRSQSIAVRSCCIFKMLIWRRCVTVFFTVPILELGSACRCSIVQELKCCFTPDCINRDPRS